MTYPLVRELAAEGVPVRLTCGVLGFSPQGFYRWRANPISERDWDDAHLTNVIRDVHDDDPCFGYRFIADELRAAGHQASENRVHRLCREHRIWSLTTKKGRRASGKIPGPAVHDDLIQRDFTAGFVDQVWLTDITEHPTAEGKLYGCVLKDLCSKRIVGYAFGPRMTAELATSALRQAVARRRPKGTVVVHSDRGGQGEFNWSSQHLERGGGAWDDNQDGRPRRWVARQSARGICRRKSACIGDRFPHQGHRRLRGGRIEFGSGRRSLAV